MKAKEAVKKIMEGTDEDKQLSILGNLIIEEQQFKIKSRYLIGETHRMVGERTLRDALNDIKREILDWARAVKRYGNFQWLNSDGVGKFLDSINSKIVGKLNGGER